MLQNYFGQTLYALELSISCFESIITKVTEKGKNPSLSPEARKRRVKAEYGSVLLKGCLTLRNVSLYFLII